jgi:hypothetical protein
MKIMARHGSASVRKEASTRKETSPRKEALPGKEASTRKETSPIKETPHVIDAALKRRARLLISNSSIPSQTRSLIQYALEIRDPYLAQVVRRVEGGEMNIERLYVE